MGVCRELVSRSILWVAVLVLAAIPVAAQMPTGAILGTVKDSSGASIPGATVTVRNTDTNLTRTQMTEQDGSYRFPELPVGHYEAKAEAPGFKTETRTGMTLEITQQGVVNFALQVGATTQQVTVSSEIPMVNTQDSTLGATVNQQQMAELPLNGRNYIDLALSRPGVNQDKNQHNSAGTSFSVNGAPVRSNNFTLDGAILQNSNGRSPAAGDSGDALGLDGIKEYRIVTGIFQAEYGLAMGSRWWPSARAGRTSSTATPLNISGTPRSMPMTSSKGVREARSRRFKRINLEHRLAAPSRKTRRSSTPSTKEFGNRREFPSRIRYPARDAILRTLPRRIIMAPGP